MRKIKYALAILLLSVASIFVSEYYIFHLDNFQGKYAHTTFYKPANVSDKEMNEEIQQAAHTHNIQIFAVDRKIHSSIRSDITVYGNEDAIKVIEDNGVLFKINRSLFLGSVNIEAQPYTALQNNERGHDYYLIGEPDNLYTFKQALVTNYAGGFPIEGAPADEGSVVATFLAVVLALLLFLTFYEVQFYKKEVLLRSLMGESIKKIIVKRIVKDVCVFTVIYSLCFIATSPFQHSLFHFKENLITFFAFLILNSFCYLLLLTGSPKQILASTHGKRLLTLNYGLKVVVSILSILAMTAMATFINQGINFYKQQAFMSTYKDYSYIQLDYLYGDNFNKTVEIQEAFYKKFQAQSVESVSLQEAVKLNLNFDYPVVKMNTGYIPNLPETIQQQLTGEFVYMLIPQKMKNRELPSEGLQEVYSHYEYGHPDFQVMYYDDNIEVFTSKERYYPFRTWLVKNPIILLNNSMDLPIQKPSEVNRLYIAYDFMYDITTEEYEQFLAAHQFEDELHIRTNVGELYEHHWVIVKRGVYMSIVLLLLIFLLNTFVMTTILRMEYTLNAKQLLLMKLFGGSIWQRNKKIILLTVLTTLISTMVAISIGLYANLPHIHYLFVGSTLLLLIEMVILFLNIRNVEKSQLVKILKGGFL